MSSPAEPARLPRPGIAEAEALHRAGKLEEAAAACRRLMGDPDSRAAALHRLGLIELSRSRIESAVHVLGAAAKAQPHSVQVWNDLGNALTAAGRTADALASYVQAADLDPNFAGAHHNAGLALQKLGRFAEAVLSARGATALAPDWAAAHHALGCALRSAQQLAEAAQAFAAAVRLRPDVPAYWRDQGGSLVQLLQFDAALAAIESAMVLAPRDGDLRLRRAEILFLRGDYDAAAAAFRTETSGAEVGAAAWSGLARVRLSQGNFAAAAEALRAGLELQPAHADSLRLMALLAEGTPDAGELRRLAAVADQPSAAASDRIAAGFALGKRLDDAGRHDEAFARFAAANAAFRERRAAAGARFSPAALRASVDRLIAEPPPDSAWIDSEVPVFVLGMPRSGTSLVEQIAASHPSVFGAGELTALHAYARTRESMTAEWAEDHLQRLQALAPEAARVIDKTPDNLFHLALIARAYARPRIVLCVRDPRDTCLSCFFTYFPTGNLWSYDLEDCGVRYAEAGRLARHWIGSPLLRLHVLHYESLVAEPEREIRRLVAFLGLPWDEACLRFHRTVRPVATPSFWQVRQPIYDRSVGRWRRYEKHLAPLIRGLGALNGPPFEPISP